MKPSRQERTELSTSGTDPRGFLEETREALVEAAFELIERDGFAATTAADIAQKAGFTERTFFRYFPSKEDVVFSPLELRFDEYVPCIRKHISAHGLTVDSLIDAIFEAHEHDPSKRTAVLRSMELAIENPELERRLAYHLRWITDRIAETAADALGRERPEVSVQVVVAVAVTIMATAVSHWVDSDRGTPIRDVVDNLRRTAEAGITGTGIV